MLYALRDVSYAPGGHEILTHADFEIKSGEKIAVVGLNGAGKTTLLKLLAGEIEPDRDDKRQLPEIEKSEKISIDILHQTREEDIKEELSGGEKTRKALIKLFRKEPDLLLLDEPTNHLDVETLEKVESFIRGYPKAVVMVSHDRYFMDQTADVIYDLSAGKLTRYSGNYTNFRKEKTKIAETARRERERQLQEIKRLEDLIERFKTKPTKASMARAKKKQLERMEITEVPATDNESDFHGRITPEYPGPKLVWEAEELKCGYEGKTLFEISLRIRRGQKIGLVGRNGCGKSTLLKTIAGVLLPIKGKAKLSEHITIGYFDQNLVSSCSTLSGGEQAKQKLREIIENAPNFLVLDEPTNHMDIPSQESIEAMLKAYTGTVICASHDRYFLSQVCDSLIVFDGEEPKYYPFGYDHYVYRKNLYGKNDMTAMVDARTQKILKEFEDVPKPERGRLRVIPAEEVYRDSRSVLMMEEADILREEAEEAYYRFVFENGSEAEYKKVFDEWTQSLLEWYDIQEI